jgi:hypothetical protein
MGKWVWNGTLTTDFGPDKDTGWIVEPVIGKHHPPGATYTIIQDGGAQSATRDASGITQSSSVKSGLEALLRTTASLVDHMGRSNSVYVASMKFDEVLDAGHPGLCFRWTTNLIRIS